MISLNRQLVLHGVNS